MTAPSSAKLAAAIRSHPAYSAVEPNNPLLQLAARAEADYYNDYLSPLALPCVQLMNDLQGLGLDDLASRHSNGEFDAGLEESAAWKNSEEGQEALNELSPEMRKVFE